MSSNLAIGNINNNAAPTVLPSTSEGRTVGLQRRVVRANPPDNCCTRIKECFKHIAEFFANAVSTSENVQSVVKFGKSTISFIRYAFQSHSEGFNNLKDQLDIVDGVLDVTGLFSDIEAWVVPVANPSDPKSPKKVFWRQKETSKWKILSKAFGTASKVVGVVKFVLDIGLVKLGQLSATLNTIPFFQVILQFSPLRVVKDACTVISASFSIINESLGIHQKRQWNRDFGAIWEVKIVKWKAKEGLREYLALTTAEKQAKLEEEFRNKNIPVDQHEPRYLEILKQQYLGARTALASLNVRPKTSEQYPQGLAVNAPERKEAKWEIIDARYRNGELLELNKQKCDQKITEKVQKIKNNGRISQNKNWFAIAFNVAKIGAMILGFVGIFASAIGGTLPFIIAVSTAWFITSSIGMARLYYGFKNRGIA